MSESTRTVRGNARHEIPDPLREDVRLLGGFLGRVLREDGGQDLLDAVEHLRELTIGAYGDPSPHALDEAADVVASFSVERAEQVARAFTCYFHLANLAEEHHRVRVLHSREADTSSRPSTLEGTIPAALAQLTDEVGQDEAQRRLDELEFRPVLTAHPTEARRRAISGTIRRIADFLTERDTRRLGGVTLAENERRILAEIDTMWRTAPVRSSKPSVLDEVKTIMGVFDAVLVDVFGDVYRRLDDWLLAEDAGRVTPVAKPFVKLGTWIGGDRDGNPNVTAEVTRQAAALAADHALAALERLTAETGRRLTLDAAGTPPSSELNALWQRIRQMSEEVARRAEEASPNEPHRAVVLALAERVAATRSRNADLAYATAEQFETDLLIVQNSLVAGGAARAAYGDLQRLLWQVQTFGFHLAELEIRQHSQVHAAALDEIRELGIKGALSETTREVLDTYRALGAIQRRFGERAARRYIVSFTQAPEHLAAVYELAAYAFADDPEAGPVIDAIPLFETFADLQNSVPILNAMLTLPAVQKRLAENGRRVEVMLGYSDSSKDVGPVAATLTLHAAQARIAEWADHNHVQLTLFHGRGGALGRGGGPANRAVLAQPPHSVEGRFKLTEQGEVILARYGDPVIASRHIEQVAAATLLASAPSVEAINESATAKFAPLATMLDAASRDRFHELVNSDGFPQWFAQVTPLKEIGLLPIGSRPAKRGLSVDSLDDLRAIPWVFSWSQARINLAAWFGLGTALAACGDVELLRSARNEWPLFTTLLDNVEMSLAKTDERIAAQYLALGSREDLTTMVLDELSLTREWVLKISGNDWPLASKRVLGRAVQLRSPYVDALSLLQVRALRGLRTGADGNSAVDDNDAAQLQHLLLLTVNGVSAGLQNTG